MAITSGGDARTQSPEILKPPRKPSLPSFLFQGEVVILDLLLEVGGNGRTKKKKEENDFNQK